MKHLQFLEFTKKIVSNGFETGAPLPPTTFYMLQFITVNMLFNDFVQ